VKARKLGFAFGDTALDRWHRDDPTATHFYNAFFMIIPAYERLVVTVVNRAVRGQVPRALKQAVHFFSAQEGSHSREHSRYNQALAGNGYPGVRAIDRFHQRVVDLMLRALPPRFLQGITAYGEHMTAVTCGEYLAQRPMVNSAPANVVDDFWTWHSQEEVDHKALCFDVFVAVCGVSMRSYLLRVAGVAVAFPLFQVTIFLNHLYLLYNDGRLFDRASAKALLRIWRRHLAVLLRSSWDYARPEFRP
jgi:predicted metal-dependent hydrolase